MQNKLKIINDPVHGFIKIPHEILFDVIEHPYFQRLRRIGQTGMLSLIYPGATHTRFHHALGAMHLMFKALEALRLKGVCISKDEEKAALLAILLHDIGHGPFSHALESVLMDWHHEKLSLLLMQELNRDFSGELDLAIEMFRGQYHRQFFNELVSSQLDVDRMDYLKRDSFYTGVSEGNVNTDRIISMLNVADDRLVVDAKGVYSIENYLTARMFMYWQVYYHKTAALSERILVRILQRARELTTIGMVLPAPDNLLYFLHRNDFVEANSLDISKFTKLDDNDIITSIKWWQDGEDPMLSYLCKSVLNRNLPKTKLSANAFSDETVLEKQRKSMDYFKQPWAAGLVEQISRSLLPYSDEKQGIILLEKSGKKVLLEASQHQILSSAITKQNTKYILYYPREIQ